MPACPHPSHRAAQSTRAAVSAVTRSITTITTVLATVLATALTLAVGAPAHAAPAAEIYRMQDALILRGEVDRDDADRVARLLSPGVTTLRVHTVGGDFAATLAIAELLHERRLALHVQGLCASACAQFLLPAARHGLTVDDGSVVALHAASHGAWRSALAAGALAGAEYAPLREDVATLQARIDSMVQVLGLDARALDFMMALTSPGAVRPRWATDAAGARQLVLDAGRAPLCAGWLADGAALRALGVAAPDWRPPALEEAAAALQVPAAMLYAGPARRLDARGAARLQRCEQAGALPLLPPRPAPR